MALDSLFIAYARTEKIANAADVRAAINGLFQQLRKSFRITIPPISHARCAK